MQSSFGHRLATAAIGLVATLLSSPETTAYATDRPGVVEMSFPAPHHNRPIEGVVWYPAGAGGTAEIFAENAVFRGIDVQRDAEVAKGQHAVVLLSHGMGGHYRSLGWLAAGLVDHGAIVVAVNHPGSTFGDFDINRSLDHITRAADLRAALDAVLADPRFAATVDGARTYVTGFSLGGWTALSLGGLTGDLEAYKRHCDEPGISYRDCEDLRRMGVDFSRFTATEWNKSLKDDRIVAVAAIDPGLHFGLSAANTADLVENVLLIGLGSGVDRLAATDFSAAGSNFAALVPNARIATLAPAFHFTGLPECKPGAAEILIEEKDDPVCTDPEGTDRVAVHAEIVRLIAMAFELN